MPAPINSTLIPTTAAGALLGTGAGANSLSRELSLGTGLSITGTTLNGSSATGTNTGDQTTIVGITGTLAQFNAACTDADFARTDAANTFVGHQTIEGVTSTGATGTNKFVFDTSPILVTPTLGVATATSVNKVAITAPATGSTLTIDDGFTLHVTGNVTALSGSHAGTSSGTNTGDQTLSGLGGIGGTFGATANTIGIRGADATTVAAGGGTLTSGGVMVITTSVQSPSVMATSVLQLGSSIYADVGTKYHKNSYTYLWSSGSNGGVGPFDMGYGRHAANVMRLNDGSTGAGKLLIGPSTTTIGSELLHVDGSVVIGSSGTPILKVLSATATLDFGSVAAGSFADLAITVTGAAVGDTAMVNGPAAVLDDVIYNAWVSAADTVTVRAINNELVTARDPASGTFRATVLKF